MQSTALKTDQRSQRFMLLSIRMQLMKATRLRRLHGVEALRLE